MASLSVDGQIFTPNMVIGCAISVSPSPLMPVPAPFDAVVGSPLSVLGAGSPLNTFSSSRRQAGVRFGALRIAPLDDRTRTESFERGFCFVVLLFIERTSPLAPTKPSTRKPARLAILESTSRRGWNFPCTGGMYCTVGEIHLYSPNSGIGLFYADSGFFDGKNRVFSADWFKTVFYGGFLKRGNRRDEGT